MNFLLYIMVLCVWLFAVLYADMDGYMLCIYRKSRKIYNLRYRYLRNGMMMCRQIFFCYGILNGVEKKGRPYIFEQPTTRFVGSI